MKKIKPTKRWLKQALKDEKGHDVSAGPEPCSWNNRIDVYKFAQIRKALGQKKYGHGRANAGWRRDNGRDVMEELHDAIVICGYWESRLQEWAKKMGVIESERLLKRIDWIIRTLWDLLGDVEDLRAQAPSELTKEEVPDRFPPARDVAYNTLTEHLRQASETVSKWPKWKRDLLEEQTNDK